MICKKSRIRLIVSISSSRRLDHEIERIAKPIPCIVGQVLFTSRVGVQEDYHISNWVIHVSEWVDHIVHNGGRFLVHYCRVDTHTELLEGPVAWLSNGINVVDHVQGGPADLEEMTIKCLINKQLSIVSPIYDQVILAMSQIVWGSHFSACNGSSSEADETRESENLFITIGDGARISKTHICC